VVAVVITIQDTQMASNTNHHRAFLASDGTGDRWAISWLPGRRVNRNQAITAMVLAEHVTGATTHRHPQWPFIEAWARELGLTAATAVAMIRGDSR
jgi:hypothetical protein